MCLCTSDLKSSNDRSSMNKSLPVQFCAPRSRGIARLPGVEQIAVPRLVGDACRRAALRMTRSALRARGVNGTAGLRPTAQPAGSIAGQDWRARRRLPWCRRREAARYAEARRGRPHICTTRSRQARQTTPQKHRGDAAGAQARRGRACARTTPYGPRIDREPFWSRRNRHLSGKAQVA